MQKYVILIIFISFIGCTNQLNKNTRYTEEQITSLHLDSTTILTTKTDSLINIDLNPFLKKQSFDFSALVEKIKLIPLETTDESLLSDINKILVTDSNIYILDNFKGRGIAIFDLKGKFVKRLSHGQGPGELVRLYDIAYDYENNELVAYQHSFLLFYTPQGEFIRQTRLPFGFHDFTTIPSGYVFKTHRSGGNEHLENLQNYTLLITDKKLELKSVGIFCEPMDNVLSGHFYLYNNNQTVMATQRYSDTICQYMDRTKQLEAKYVLNYNNKKLPERYLHCNTYDEFDKTIRENNYYFYLGYYQETTTHHVFFLENYTIGQTVIYRNKLSGNLIGGTNAGYNANEIPQIAFPIASTNDCFISVCLPNKNFELLSNSSIISDEDKIKIKDLQDDDNPILVFYQLKDF